MYSIISQTDFRNKQTLQEVLDWCIKNISDKWTRININQSGNDFNFTSNTLGEALRRLSKIGILGRNLLTTQHIEYRVNPDIILEDEDKVEEEVEEGWTESDDVEVIEVEEPDTRFSLVEGYQFDGNNLDIYVKADTDELWITRQQLGEALDYAEPRITLGNLHSRHKERLDGLSDTVRLTASDGKTYETFIYNQRGIIEVCRHSEQPKADKLLDSMLEIADDVLDTSEAEIVEPIPDDTGFSLVKSYQFYDDDLDVYIKDNTDEVWVTRQQIGRALDYVEPSIAIGKIHNRHEKRLGKFSCLTRLVNRDGNYRKVFVYNQKGIFEICRHSEQPKADRLIDRIWEIADEVLKTGSYGSISPEVQALLDSINQQTVNLKLQSDNIQSTLSSHAEVKEEVEDMKAKANEADEALKQKELPIPSLLPSSSTRQKINKLVRDYAIANHADFYEVWNKIYYQFSVVHHVNLGKQAGRYGLSRLEYLEFVNQIDDLYAVAYNLLISP